LRSLAIVILAAALGSGLSGCSSRSAGPAWGDSPRVAFSQAEKDRRAVLVYLADDWNEWCKRMDQETFRDPEVLRALEPYLLVRQNPEVDKELALRNNVFLLPAALVFDWRGEMVYRITGFRNARQMVRELAAGLEAAGVTGVKP